METMTMTKNPILDELREIREQLLADAGGTLDGLVDRLQSAERQSDRPRFQPQRTNGRAETVKSGVSAVEHPSSPPGDP